MNPAAMMKMKDQIVKFQLTHPKLVSFVKEEMLSGVPEGSVIEVSITKPGADKVTTNIRVQQSDLELMETLKQIQ